MLPFLKPKQQTGLIIAQRKPDGQAKVEHSEGEELHELEAHMDDLIRAIHAKDSKSAAEAYKRAFECCESYPHEEGPHVEEDEE